MSIARRAFTFLEVMVVVVMIGILAAIVIPSFGTVNDDAKAAAAQASLASVRGSITAFRNNQMFSGSARYPTLAELTTAGTVVAGTLPANPFNGLSTVQSVSSAAASNRTVSNTGTYGWNYYIDNALNPPAATFYLNSSSSTSISNGSGGYKTANQL